MVSFSIAHSISLEWEERGTAMTNHGTASIGLYIELQAAVLRQLPRPGEMTSEIVDGWIQNQASLKRILHEVLLPPVDVLPEINWQLVYSRIGMSKEVSGLSLPESDLSLWTVPVIRGVTFNKVVGGFRKSNVDICVYVDDLDEKIVQNDRDPNKGGSYVVRFKRTVEADEENKDLSANVLAGRGVKGITLLERLLLGLGFFLTTKGHLDVNSITLCSGSRDFDGYVPRVGWNSYNREVYVHWSSLDAHRGRLRARSVVLIL